MLCNSFFVFRNSFFVIRFSFSRFAEVAEDGAYLEGGEELLGLAIAGALEGFGELGVLMDPGHQSVDGALWREVGGVGHGDLGLAHGTHTPAADFFLLHGLCRFVGHEWSRS